MSIIELMCSLRCSVGKTLAVQVLSFNLWMLSRSSCVAHDLCYTSVSEYQVCNFLVVLNSLVISIRFDIGYSPIALGKINKIMHSKGSEAWEAL